MPTNPKPWLILEYDYAGIRSIPGICRTKEDADKLIKKKNQELEDEGSFDPDWCYCDAVELEWLVV